MAKKTQSHGNKTAQSTAKNAAMPPIRLETVTSLEAGEYTDELDPLAAHTNSARPPNRYEARPPNRYEARPPNRYEARPPNRYEARPPNRYEVVTPAH
ncbi:MAG: hypothetical protein IPK82_20765 [Polyangiaceae bacterium]|nr:hypothetical protein [Polyangiaceae bacterium]